MKDRTYRKWAAVTGNGAQGRRTRKLLRQYMVIALAAMVIMGAVSTVFLARSLRVSEETSGEALLRLAAGELAADLEQTGAGDWGLSDTGVLVRGSVPAADAEPLLERLKKNTGLDYAVYFGRQQVLSTKEQGMPAAEEVFSGVVIAGRERFVPAENGVADVYYMPLRNPDGTTIGMAAAYRMRGGFLTGTGLRILLLALLMGGLAALAAGALVLITNRIGRQMEDLTTVLNGLSRGSLGHAPDPRTQKRDDEIGELANSARQLDERLTRVIHSAREVAGSLCDSGFELADSAEVAADASWMMADRIEEVRKGAASQAECVRLASNDAGDIDQGVRELSEDVEQIGDYAVEIAACGTRASDHLADLHTQTDGIADAVNSMGESMRITADAAERITGISRAITAIATQTNVLSLNASIEASRAGDAGKAFAVVADEIRQLADQTGRNAQEISRITDELIRGSARGSASYETMKDNTRTQEELLAETRSDMQFMKDSLHRLGEASERAACRMEDIRQTREDLEGVIRDLAAAAVQNVAFTEETTASMQELHTTFTVMSESAGQLQVLADDLRETVSFFRE